MNKVWVLTYTIGTNEGRKQRRLTCDTKEFAEKQQAVLGGEIREYAELDDCDRKFHNEAVFDLVVDEVACLIDDMSNHSPGGVWENPWSTEWDCAKVEALNTIRKILDELM